MSRKVFSRQDMLGYGHAAYCGGWSAAFEVKAGRGIGDHHGYDWLRDHPPSNCGEPLWRGLPPLSAPDGLALAQSILADCTDATPVEWIEMARGIVAKAEGV